MGYALTSENPISDRHHPSASSSAVRGQQPAPFEHEAGRQRARGIRREQNTVEHPRITVPEVIRKARHLRVVAIANEEGGGACQ